MVSGLVCSMNMDAEPVRARTGRTWLGNIQHTINTYLVVGYYRITWFRSGNRDLAIYDDHRHLCGSGLACH